jgi:hypothetical protein
MNAYEVRPRKDKDSRSMTSGVQADPGILELVGEIADLLGLAEHVQRLLPIQRIKVERRHRAC